MGEAIDMFEKARGHPITYDFIYDFLMNINSDSTQDDEEFKHKLNL